MVNQTILSKEVQEYIEDNLNMDLSKLCMKKSPFFTVSSLEIVQQVQGKRIAMNKFPFLCSNTQIIYPPHINLEQASSQSTALFKQKIIKGKIGADLTGGIGIDTLYISEKTEKFYYVEPNLELLEIAQHNFLTLGRKNIISIYTTAEEFLSKKNNLLDFIYLDPSRRDKNKNKKIILEELSPNVVQLKDKLLKIATTVYVKLSPLLDIQKSIEQLPITNIYIISVKNEVKELLFQLKIEAGKNKNPIINCINLESEQVDFSFRWKEEKEVGNPLISYPKEYLYIPNTSILKSGAFKLIGNKFKLNKLHINTHIYTSNKQLDNFPGRTFFVLDANFDIKKSGAKKFNIIVKNYPLTVNEIKKKYNLIEGGDRYLIFVKSENKNLCVLCKLETDIL